MCARIEKKGGVFMHSNIYEFLCEKIDNIPHILALCGAEKRYTNENASDFEKIRELCHLLVKFSGSSIYRDINCAVSEVLGENVDITQALPEDLWKMFWGERGNRKTITPVLCLKTTYDDKLTNAIDISRATGFVMPDRYHVGLAREKLNCGQELFDSEKNMLIVQQLREGAQNCINSWRPLVIRADCSFRITRRAIQYLKTCNLLPETLVLVSLDRLDVDAQMALGYDGISLGVLVDKCDEGFAFAMQSIARTYPIGNFVWVLKNDDFNNFCNISGLLLKEWQAENTTPENCTLKFEEICKFY